MKNHDIMRQFGSLSLGSRLKRLSDQLFQDVIEIYQRSDIPLSPTYFPLFNLLAQHGSASVTEAAEQLNVSHPAISKMARKMLAEGWLCKTPDPKDERRQLLALSSQSEQLLVSIQPVWHEIRHYLDSLMAQHQHSLLNALDEFENDLRKHGFVEPVLQQLGQQRAVAQIEILNWSPEYREHFRSLNLAWLDKYFDGELTEHDRSALDEPESYYLSRGGYIWFARVKNDIVGCVALACHGNGCFEISKMGVTDQLQGFGIGRQLLLTALDKARALNATHLYLESSTKLERAIALYRHMGFREVPHPNGCSIYPRSDIYMTLQLHQEAHS